MDETIKVYQVTFKGEKNASGNYQTLGENRTIPMQLQRYARYIKTIDDLNDQEKMYILRRYLRLEKHIENLIDYIQKEINI